MTPFFQASHRSLAYQFTVNTPLLCHLFSIFRKFLHFQPCFGQKALDPDFSEFLFPRPPFFKENPLPRPHILKPAWHTSTKKMLSAPPPGKFTFRCEYLYRPKCNLHESCISAFLFVCLFLFCFAFFSAFVSLSVCFCFCFCLFVFFFFHF